MRAWTRVALTAACVAFCGGRVSAAPAPARVGLFVQAGAPDADAIAAGFRDAFRAAAAAGRAVEIEERTAADDGPTRAALKELVHLGAAVVAAIGDDAAPIAAEAVRDRQVVVAARDGSVTPDARVLLVSTTPEPARLAEAALAVRPQVRKVAVLGPLAGTADAVHQSLSSRGLSSAASERVRWTEGSGYRAAALGGFDLVLATPEAEPAHVGDLVRELGETSAVAVVGTRGDHLDAGAAVVLRTAPRDVGALAAVACLEALEGRTGGSRTRRPRRLVREVHLGNARRLGVVVPGTVLAASDRTTPAPTERR